MYVLNGDERTEIKEPVHDFVDLDFKIIYKLNCDFFNELFLTF